MTWHNLWPCIAGGLVAAMKEKNKNWLNTDIRPFFFFFFFNFTPAPEGGCLEPIPLVLTSGTASSYNCPGSEFAKKKKTCCVFLFNPCLATFWALAFTFLGVNECSTYYF